jgi:hypothetical protein
MHADASRLPHAATDNRTRWPIPARASLDPYHGNLPPLRAFLLMLLSGEDRFVQPFFKERLRGASFSTLYTFRRTALTKPIPCPSSPAVSIRSIEHFHKRCHVVENSGADVPSKNGCTENKLATPQYL